MLDQLVALGDLARQINLALGGNGHRPQTVLQAMPNLIKQVDIPQGSGKAEATRVI